MASNEPGTFNQGLAPSDQLSQLHGSPSPRPSSPGQQQQQQQQQQQGSPNVTPANASQGGREVNKRVLYVGGVDQNVTEDMLSELFKVTGNVSSIKIFPDKNRRGFNYAFVEYEDHSAADLAFHTLNHRVLNQSEININWAYQTQQTTKDPEFFNIFVGDLSSEVNDDFLSKAFSVYGSMVEARVMWDMTTGRSRGYGFVSFRERADAEQALSSMDGEWLGSRTIRCNWASQKQAGFMNHGNKHAPPMVNPMGMVSPNGYDMVLHQTPNWQTTVYIGNLAPFTSPNDLVTMLQNFGYIVDFKYQQDRGYAFVKYDSHERAAMAITHLSNIQINGRILRVGWGKDRNNQNQNQNMNQGQNQHNSGNMNNHQNNNNNNNGSGSSGQYSNFGRNYPQ